MEFFLTFIPTDIYKEIDVVRGKLEEAFAAKRFEDVSKLYTEDCRFMPPGQPLISGREGVCAAATQMWTGGIRTIKLEMEEAVGLGGDWAYSRGFVTFLLEDGSVAMPGKYFALWKRVDGQLQLFTDIFNRIK
ncbi:hypothetical protein BSL78_15934 [Apostichopus japonicus]|uniref:DUF4440 domain-containing protein n=1 Tax=Stichopus japonicus TaxID=307972 RepID=A0A2G8KGT3_STIJA|nr:hypothetical protein BSL78_15934 [Apostichopus japonicus]